MMRYFLAVGSLLTDNKPVTRYVPQVNLRARSSFFSSSIKCIKTGFVCSKKFL